MNLNATLFYQCIVFFVLAWVTMKFVWPPIMTALDERREKIAKGLAAADQGKIALQKGEEQVRTLLTKANEDGLKKVADAEKYALQIIEEAKKQAATEAERIIAAAKADADNQVSKAREELRDSVATLAVKGAEQILKREINASAHADLLNQLKTEL